MYVMYVCRSVCLCVCMSVCMYVCMYLCTSPLLPSISRKIHGFSRLFAKRMSKNTEFCQIFGKRMQEAQASKKAGRGNRAWDPCFATPAPRRLRLVERHQIAARYVWGPPPKKKKNLGVILYPLLGVRHAEQCRRIRRTRWGRMSVVVKFIQCFANSLQKPFL